jgi:MerR family copper efflux transcriptional regulator
MNIGSIASETGVSTKTIRYYESIGLIPEPPRQDNGYRSYSPTHVETLRFIQRARSLGFSLKDISKLLGLWQDSNRPSADVKELTLHHIGEIENKIKELESVRDSLKALAGQCTGDDRPDCPILEDLASTKDIN